MQYDDKSQLVDPIEIFLFRYNVIFNGIYGNANLSIGSNCYAIASYHWNEVGNLVILILKMEDLYDI